MIFSFNGILFGQITYLYLLIPLLIFLYILLRKRYVNEEQRLYKKKGKKRIIFLIRVLFFAALLLALCNPYIEKKEEQGNITKIKVLIDESYSTRLYDIASVENTLENIKKEGISVDIEKLNLEDYSSLGNAILNNLEPEQNILLVSDGQNNFGSSLEDISLFAGSLNSRIFGIELEPKKRDAAILIEGPSKVVSEVENTFTISLKEVDNILEKSIKVFIDEILVFEGEYKKQIEVKRSFSSGNHVIKAVLETDELDFFPENNVFYKTVSVYKKLKILLISENGSPIENLYSPFYNLDIRSTLPNNLNEYYAIILNNVNAAKLSNDNINRLEEFVSDGNGLFVIGGKDSFDWGDYNTSLITSILPVSVGMANKKKDITNIVILMDTGASGADTIVEGITYFDVQKTIAADIVRSISPTNKVGMIEANYNLNTLTGLSELGPKRSQLITDISLLKPTGFSELRFAYQKAHEMLKITKGSKNIVIITDGKLIPVDQSLTLNFVQKAYFDGIKTFIIGVGESADENFLMSVKELGGGEYFRTDEKNKIIIYFGDPSQTNLDDLNIFVYDSNHFITKELKELGSIYGFNSVYPKANARLLLTTNTGDPVLTIWNYGLGRVAALSTDDGSTWVPDLLEIESSKALIKTLNWLIEDPERKNSLIIELPELRLGENSIITVKSDFPPTSEKLSFYEISKGIFKASYYPNTTGIINLLVPMAVNYKKEYLNIGINEDFERILKISGGELLENDAAIIADKLKSVAKVDTIKRIDISWLFIMIACIIYLIELFIRRIFEMKIRE